MCWAIIKDSRKIRSGSGDYSSDSYDINKAAKDIADKTKKEQKNKPREGLK